MGRAMSNPLAPLSSIPSTIQTVADYEIQAQQHLSAEIWAYLYGGAMDENSIQQNRQSYQDIKLLPRHLKNLNGGNTQCQIMGETYAHPIFLAPVAYQKLFHPDGELATALAAQVMQSNLILSTLSTTPMRELTQQTLCPAWFQLYWQDNRASTLALVKQAEQSGFKALVITIDSPHSGVRDRERKLGFNLPSHIIPAHMSQPAQLPPLKINQHPIFDSLMAIAPQWEDIEWLITQTSLPIILKGILHPADAALAVQRGVQGIIISNHGGRILDTAISPIEVLPAIRTIVPDGFPLLIDSGIRRGTDIFKALALGASAVLIGRPYIYGLATAGALGVAHVIRLLKEELEITMALCGTKNLTEITKDYVLLS